MVHTPGSQQRRPTVRIPDGRYECPVCGVELSISSVLTPERDYYCPACATRQKPSLRSS